MHAKEIAGVFVTPVFSKTFWYNSYSYRLPDVMKDFKILLRSTFDDAYCSQILRLTGKMDSADKNAQISFSENQNFWNENCVNTLKRYAGRWGVKLNIYNNVCDI